MEDPPLGVEVNWLTVLTFVVGLIAKLYFDQLH